MVVNRMDLIRVLKIVKSVGQTEVKFDVDGKFGVAFPDGCGVLFGQGMNLGQQVAFMDIDMLLKMLDSFSQMEISIEFKEGRMLLSGGEVRYGYRLADWDLVEGFKEEETASITEGWEWTPSVLRFEELNKVGKLIKAMLVDKVTFRDENDKLVVRVGDKNMYFGEIELAGVGLKEEILFEANKLADIIAVLDEGKVGFDFGIKKVYDEGLKREYTEGILRVVNSGFTWFLGMLKSQ